MAVIGEPVLERLAFGGLATDYLIADLLAAPGRG